MSEKAQGGMRMEDKKEDKNERVANLIWSVCLLLLGIGSLFCSYLWANEAYFPKYTPVEITGTISDIQKNEIRKHGKHKIHYDVYVDYTYNNVEYKHIGIGDYDAGMAVNEPIKLKINPANPGNTRSSDGEFWGVIVFALLGVVMVLIGIWSLKSQVRKIREDKKTEANGVKS